MEVIIAILIIWGIGALIRALSAGTKAAVSASQGRGSFKENIEVQYKGMRPLEVKVENSTISDANLPIWNVRIRGLFQVSSVKDLAVITSLIDVTDRENPQVILIGIEKFQEQNTRAFQNTADLGICEPNQGFIHWVTVGVIPKEILMFPFSGKRKVAIVVRVVDKNNLPKIELGFAKDHPGIIRQFTCTEYLDVDRGFLERSEEELGIAAASLRLGLAVAFSDGGFDPLEGRVIKEWSAKFVNEVPEGSGRTKAREFINDAIRYGSEDAKNKNLSISSQVSVLNELASKPEKYAAMELCLDVMAADGSADSEELKMLNRLCESLNLDADQFNNLRDHRLLTVDSNHMNGKDIWETLAINTVLPREEKLQILRKLYRKWNAAAESLEDGQDREKAHQMIELIAEARKLLNA